MPIKKYINTAEVAMLTGLQQDDIRNLAKTNVLPSHKNRRGHYRFNVDAVEKYFGKNQGDRYPSIRESWVTPKIMAQKK